MLDIASHRGVASDVAGLIARRRPSFSLEAALYTSQDVFDLDVELIFGRQWIFAGPEAALPEPGDYAKLDFGRYSIITLRDDDGGVRAFHNVCRHRGARLLNECNGTVGNIVCPYHQWTYDTGGKLLDAEGDHAFDRAQYGLKPVHIHNVAGLLFVCLAKEAPTDFDKFAAEFEPYLLPHGIGDSKVAYQMDIVEKGNWKLTMENNRECYHCGGHPELSVTAFGMFGYNEDNITPEKEAVLRQYKSVQSDFIRLWEGENLPWHAVEHLDDRQAGFRAERHPLDGPGEAMTMDGKAACKRTMGRLKNFRLGRLHLHTQPNSWHHFQADHAVTFCVLPISPGETLLRTTWLVHKDAVEGVDYELDNLIHVWRETNRQDQHFVELAHLGALSPAYEPGPYAPSEGQVDKFCSWYVTQLGSNLARR
jgi:Rieske 2Fe-2S family protein